MAVTLSLPLICVNRWPERLKKYLPLYWHLTLLYSIPFFATFMLLENQLSFEWLMNVSLGLFWFILLVDWVSFIILLFLGSALGFLAFIFFGSVGFSELTFQDPSLGLLTFYMYTYAIILGLIFSRNKTLLEVEKQRTLTAAAGTIAHEMRTPLSSVTMHTNLIGLSINQLEDLKKKLKGESAKTLQHEIDDIQKASHSLLTVSQESHNIINLLLANLKQDFSELSTEELSMKAILGHTVQEYAFKEGEAEKIHLDVKNDFHVRGNWELLTHIFFNLLKNSLYYIHMAGKGEVFITLQDNTVVFKDTGSGIEKSQLSKLFTPFYSKTPHGTGIGLSFCKKAVESMKGKITVESVFGDHTTFILRFPERRV